ncbi:crotonase/enoyl-CoA hydratase family protein [Nocardioides sp.]|uniref:crotonase/enoyl-CoA hydratase family protein n=1 Tax=Nocardioides sp. TaxID=35761 RepID=UPI003D09E236
MSNTVLAEPFAGNPHILVITLNRPDARNAVNSEVARALAATLDGFDNDPDRRVGVLTGAGAGFSAGMDLKAFLTGDLPFIDGRGFAGFTQAPPRKPLIAAIEGFALAGGLEMALACDLIVASNDARLGLPEVTRALVAAGGGLLRLAQRIPYHVAAEVALTGQPMSVDRLREVGLLNRVTEPGAALQTALKLADTIASNGPLAVTGSKHILSQAGDWGLGAGWGLQAGTADLVNSSDDAQEGSRAFAERRQPVWTGR